MLTSEQQKAFYVERFKPIDYSDFRKCAMAPVLPIYIQIYMVFFLHFIKSLCIRKLLAASQLL